MADDFQALLERCIPVGMTEEQWAVRNRLGLRTLRRAKRREVRFQNGTLRKLALAMRGLGGSIEKRVEKIAAATTPAES